MLRAVRVVRPALAAPIAARFASNTAPAAKANALIDMLPGNSLVSKTGIITLTSALAAAAISQELFVVNEEVVVLAGFVVFVAGIGSVARKPYTEWADAQIQKFTNILNESRNAHTQAVESRISEVSELKDVEQLTKTLFDLSKQTVELEKSTFELKQKAALSSDIKAVLDSWVRHEAQVREAEQQDLVKTVAAKIEASLKDPKFQREILAASVADVEALVKANKI